MKKFLLTAVALGIVAGVATTASAWEFKMDGKYQADGFWFSNGVDDTSDSQDWYEHDFRINPTIIVNDRTQFKMDVRLVDSNRVWGNQPGGDNQSLADGKNFRVRKAWLIYNSPIGKWEVGRRPAGAWMGAFVNSGSAADRIMWWAPAMDNFKAYAFLQKTTEVDGYTSAIDSEWIFGGMDNDYYEVAGGYQADGVKAWLGLGTAQYDASGMEMWRLKGYGDFAINETWSISGEFDWKTGDTMNGAVDISSYAFILSGMGNFGDLSASLHWAYISGEDSDPLETTAYDVKSGTGADFEPLYILTGSAANILNGDRGPSAVGTAVRTSGANAIVALADFKTTEDLTLHGGLGWGKAAETDWIGANVDDDYGWELDLGLAYKIYENLTYELHFGWWLVGDFAKGGNPLVNTEDVYLLSHHLTMKF